MACRIQLTNEWKLRLINEASMYEDNCFITLTYRREDLEPLSKRTAQLFIKRLRRALEPKRIRYYIVGDYGGENKRPHYHALIFGWKPEEEDLSVASRKMGTTYFQSAFLRSLWTKGFNTVGTVTPDSIQYCAGYVRRAVLSERDELAEVGRVRPFALFSTGIGAAYCDANSARIREQLAVVENGKALGLPRYYVKRLGLTSGELLNRKISRTDLDVAYEVHRGADLDDIQARLDDRAVAKERHLRVLEKNHRSKRR